MVHSTSVKVFLNLHSDSDWKTGVKNCLLTGRAHTEGKWASAANSWRLKDRTRTLEHNHVVIEFKSPTAVLNTISRRVSDLSVQTYHSDAMLRSGDVRSCSPAEEGEGVSVISAVSTLHVFQQDAECDISDLSLKLEENGEQLYLLPQTHFPWTSGSRDLWSAPCQSCREQTNSHLRSFDFLAGLSDGAL